MDCPILSVREAEISFSLPAIKQYQVLEFSNLRVFVPWCLCV